MHNSKVQQTLKKIRKIIHEEQQNVRFGNDFEDDDDEYLDGKSYLQNQGYDENNDDENSYTLQGQKFDPYKTDTDNMNRFHFGHSTGILVKHS